MSPLPKTVLRVQDLRVVVGKVVGWVPDRAGPHRCRLLTLLYGCLTPGPGGLVSFCGVYPEKLTWWIATLNPRV